MAEASEDQALNRRLAAAERIAREAGRLALDYFARRDRLDVTAKGAQDRVSEADREVEALIRARITSEFPDDAILGEELGASPGASGHLWVIDPIDGTTPFLHGLADWCVSVAVARDGVPLIGVIEAPCRRETWRAGKGLGATVDGVPLAVDPTADLGSGMFAFGGSLRAGADATGALVTRLMHAGGVPYHNGSGALMLASVAAGRLVGYFDQDIRSWDCFAAMVMAEEAGAMVAFGGPDRLERGGPLLAGTPAAFAAARALIGWPPH
jgi:myo-inositol-1(or 4)-monophosphatase